MWFFEVGRPSDGFSEDEDAHEEDHDEEEPHEEAIHHLGDLPPLPDAQLRGSLVLVWVGNVLNVPAQSLVLAHTLGFHPDLPPVPPDSTSLFTSYTFLLLDMLLSSSTGTSWLLLLHLVSSSSSFLLWVVDGHKQILFPARLDGRILPPLQRLPSSILLHLPSPRLSIHVPICSFGVASIGWWGFRLLLWQRLSPGWGPIEAVLTHLVHETDAGEVVEDEALGPLWDGPSLGTAVVDVHDEDGESCRCSYHRHRRNVVLSCWKRKSDITHVYS